MLIRLALETKAHHAPADADRLSLLDDSVVTSESLAARYRTFLETVYTFESRYEQALIQTPDLEPRIVRDCTRLPQLRNDLRGLGASLADLDALPAPLVPAFRSPAHAMGWIYVVERNTLLHGLLRRHLWRMIPSAIAAGGSYLAHYASPGSHYREIGAELDDAARRTIPCVIVEAAHEAFACQRLWFARSRAVTARRLAS